MTYLQGHAYDLTNQKSDAPFLNMRKGVRNLHTIYFSFRVLAKGIFLQYLQIKGLPQIHSLAQEILKMQNFSFGSDSTSSESLFYPNIP